jgi:catechol 2,3-dioxygenase-like lactoylglutathione lyase family enzyme
MTRGPLHHVELWVPDLDRAIGSLGWLLEALGHQPFQHWDEGRSWRCGETYIVVEKSSALSGTSHDRMNPGLNHLAFHAGTRSETDQLITDALGHGWTPLFPGLHPYAGGPDNYAGYLANADGFEVELVADTGQGTAAATP